MEPTGEATHSDLGKQFQVILSARLLRTSGVPRSKPGARNSQGAGPVTKLSVTWHGPINTGDSLSIQAPGKVKGPSSF